MSSKNPVVEYRFYNENTNYGTCLTIGTVTEKVVKCENFVLQQGSEIIVRFEFTNQRENPTLNVNDTGARPIYYRGAAISPVILSATRTYLFAYNGIQYELVGDITNVYKEATMVDSGLMTPEEKQKLFSIDRNANFYTHPVGTGNRHIPSGGKKDQILKWADDGLAIWADEINYSEVSDDKPGLMTPGYKKKLDGIENNANNYTLPEAGSELGGVKSGGDVLIEDGVIKVTNYTHNHTTSDITDLNSILSDYIPKSEKGVANGIALLGEDGKLLASQIPGSVDEILEFEGVDKFPAVGESGKLYVDTVYNKTYRWSGSTYSVVSDSIALGETATTAYRGDLGKAAYDHSQTPGNPHATKFSELKSIPETFTPKSHLHSSTDINQLKGYTKQTEYAAIEPSDSLNKALGKLEKGLELKPDTDTTYNEATPTNAGLMSAADKLKLNGIEEFANNYTYILYKATDTDLGGIRIGYNQNDKNYPIQLDENGKAYVEVPWTNTDTSYTEATQSTNGLMSATDKKKLDGIDSGANDYKLPNAGDEVLGGIKTGYEQTAKNYPVQLDENNKAYVNVPWVDNNTTYNEATPTASGLMSATDKAKLNSIAENANNYTYTLLSASEENLGGIKIGYKQNDKNYPIVLDENGKAYVMIPWENTTYGEVTTEKSGLMTKDDKSKLNSIAENANNYTLPTANTVELGGIKTGYNQNNKNYPIILDNNGNAYVNVPWVDNNTYLSARTDIESQVVVGVKDGTTLLYGNLSDRKLDSIDISTSTDDLAINDTIKLALKKLQNKIDEIKSIASAGMRLKGDVSEPITTPAKIGDTYKAIAKFTIATVNSKTGKDQFVNIGDTIIAVDEKPIWTVIPSGDEILEVATSETLGGVKLGYSQNNKNYPVILDSDNKAYVNVPWTDNNTTYNEASITASGLMSSADKVKLNSIENNANNYSLPVTTKDNLGGIKVGYSQNNKNYPVQLDSDNKAYVNVPWADNNTTYNEATPTASGLMSSADKVKLNSIAENANNYTLPVTSDGNLGGIKVGYEQNGKNYPVLLDKDNKAYVNIPWTDNNTTYTLSSFGITATAAQLNHTSGVTSNIQTQLNAKQAKHSTVTVTLNSANWNNKNQTVTVSGVTASNTVIVGPAPSSVDLYSNAGIFCTTQAANSLTFSCNITPTSNISINVIILN